MSIDYQEIIEQLDDNKVKGMLDRLNIPYQDRGGYLILPTVCHHADIDEASLKLYYYKNTHIFQCFTECGAMSIFNFLKHFYEAREVEYDWYTDIYQMIMGCTMFSEQPKKKDGYKSIRANYEAQKVRRELPAYPEGMLETFVKYYPIEWLNDGISKEAMDKFNIRFSPSQNKIIIPHYDAGGRLIGIRGRALNKEDIEHWGKYAPIFLEGKCCSHPLSLNLYALNFNQKNVNRQRIAYLVEGEKSCLQAESFSTPNCTVAVCGSKFNKYQLDLLLRYCNIDEIIICFDKEELPGQDLYFNKLYNMCEKYKAYSHFSFIYDKENLLKLKDSPFDKGEQVFKQLLNHRVRVN